MYVVIAGGGKVGRYIAGELLAERHEVAIIEREPPRCEALLRDHDLLVIHGDACDVQYLEQARAERAEVFVATTGDDDDNFVACQLAITSFEIPRVISRVNFPDNEEIFRHHRIEAVSSTSLISRLIREQLTVGELVHLTTLRAGKLNLVEINMPTDAKAPTRTVAELGLPEQSVLVAIFRDEDTIVPGGATKVEPGDQVVALTKPELEHKLRSAILDHHQRGRR